MKFIFLGDVHSNLIHCLHVSQNNPEHTIIQIGDLGVGMVPTDCILRLPSNFKFFVGNHDNRQLALTLPSCLGDYGNRFDNRFFFVSGADSIDKERRLVGINWWEDEQLSKTQMDHVLDLWEKSPAQVLVSHDCPQAIVQYNHLIYDQSSTRMLLDCMINIRKPKIIIYGHHHRSTFFNYEGMVVKALGIDEVFELDL